MWDEAREDGRKEMEDTRKERCEEERSEGLVGWYEGRKGGLGGLGLTRLRSTVRQPVVIAVEPFNAVCVLACSSILGITTLIPIK